MNKLPTYTLREGAIGLNAAAEAVNAQFERLKLEKDRLDAAYVGALIASLFATHPWLASFKLGLTATSEYDDRGGTYRSINAHPYSVEAVPGTPLPEEVNNEGQFSEDYAADLLSDWFCDHEYDIYSAFVGEHDYEDLEFTLQRSALADLLAAESVAGCAAFAALFPERAALVAPVVDTAPSEILTDSELAAVEALRARGSRGDETDRAGLGGHPERRRDGKSVGSGGLTARPGHHQALSAA